MVLDFPVGQGIPQLSLTCFLFLLFLETASHSGIPVTSSLGDEIEKEFGERQANLEGNMTLTACLHFPNPSLLPGL